jgi:hypothetical protein
MRTPKFGWTARAYPDEDAFRPVYDARFTDVLEIDSAFRAAPGTEHPYPVHLGHEH